MHLRGQRLLSLCRSPSHSKMAINFDYFIGIIKTYLEEGPGDSDSESDGSDPWSDDDESLNFLATRGMVTLQFNHL